MSSLSNIPIPNCPHCGSNKIYKNGHRKGKQGYQCRECKSFFYENEPLKKEAPPLVNLGIKGISESELRSKHDNYTILRNHLSYLKPGLFTPEMDFIQICKFKTGTGFRSVLSDAEFEDYHGTAGGIVYWGTIKDILRLKSEGILR
jgi:hypothetical protein